MNSTHKRNRSPDDGFQLVGDRRRNISKVADVQESSSEEDCDLNVSEMCDKATKNAYGIHKEEESIVRKEAKKAKAEQEVEAAVAVIKKAEKKEKKKESKSKKPKKA